MSVTKMETNIKKQFLEVIWIKKPCRLMSKQFSLDEVKKAYALFDRLNDAQIVLRGADYEPSFSCRDLERGFDLWVYGTKEDRFKKFSEWLTEMLEITRET
jgi:hypothetical protein